MSRAHTEQDDFNELRSSLEEKCNGSITMGTGRDGIIITETSAIVSQRNYTVGLEILDLLNEAIRIKLELIEELESKHTSGEQADRTKTKENSSFSVFRQFYLDRENPPLLDILGRLQHHHPFRNIVGCVRLNIQPSPAVAGHFKATQEGTSQEGHSKDKAPPQHKKK